VERGRGHWQDFIMLPSLRGREQIGNEAGHLGQRPCDADNTLRPLQE